MTAPIPGRRYRAGDVEGAWTMHSLAHPYYAGYLRLDDGRNLSIARGLEQHLVPVEPTERRVVLTCGRSRVYGVLDPRGASFWYVKVDGENSGLRGFIKDAWTLADEPTEPEPQTAVEAPLNAVPKPGWPLSADELDWQHDVRRILLALGLGDHARPISCAEVVEREVLPAIASLRAAPEPVAVDVDRLAQAIAVSEGFDWKYVPQAMGDTFRADARAALTWLAEQGVPVVTKDQP